MVDLPKRRFLKRSLLGFSAIGVGAVWTKTLLTKTPLLDEHLLPPDENGVRLPVGLSSKIIARSSKTVIAGGEYVWHSAPDGGACFDAAGLIGKAGWIYVSNCEMSPAGGVGAIVFDEAGRVVDAYSILENTHRNCAGGATPWGSWLSCEEINSGRVWECYPDGKTPAVVRPALGVFNHEAVAFDDKHKHLYLTEDKSDGCLYRFSADKLTDDGFPDLSAGILEVAVKSKNLEILDWVVLPDPLAQHKNTRHQIKNTFTFDGGEGIAYYEGQIIFTTKGDNRVWSYETTSHRLKIVYDKDESLTPILAGVDNVMVSPSGEIYVAEDGGDLQIVVIDAQGGLYPVVQLEGHDRSEIAGIAFNPDADRLYFSSQRGTTGQSDAGITFEISGFQSS